MERSVQYHRPGDHSNGLKRIMLSLCLSDSYVVRERALFRSNAADQINFFLENVGEEKIGSPSVDLKLCPVQCSFKSITFHLTYFFKSSEAIIGHFPSGPVVKGPLAIQGTQV